MSQYVKIMVTKHGKHVLSLIAVIAAVPILLLAYQSGAPTGYSGAPQSTYDHGDCGTCHGYASKTTGMTVSGFPASMTYTPGVTQHLTVTVPASTSGRGFEITSRLATNTTTQEGNFSITDGNTELLTSNGLQFVTHTSSSTDTWHVDWTPPLGSVGDIVFYAAGVSGKSNCYKTSVTLTPAVVQPPAPTLSANPASLAFSYQSGDSTLPGSQTFTVSSNGAAANFSASASTQSGGNWLSVSPTIGTTGSSGTLTVSVDPTGLSANTYDGTVTITSGTASNTLTVGVTLIVTAPPSASTLIVGSTSLSFSSRKNAPKMVTVDSSGVPITYTIVSAVDPGDPGWLSASCESGECITPDTLTVTVSNTAGLAPGLHIGTLNLIPTDKSIAPASITVKIRISKR